MMVEVKFEWKMECYLLSEIPTELILLPEGAVLRVIGRQGNQPTAFMSEDVERLPEESLEDMALRLSAVLAKPQSY